MHHLGERVAALVDGRLSAAEYERAVAHLARCPRCRAEVAQQRMVKRRLAGLAPPALPGDLSTRLFGGPGPSAWPDPPRHRRVGLAAAAAAATVAATFGGAVLAGGESGSGPAVTPPVGQLLMEHAATTGEVPLVDPGVAAVTASFARVGQP